MDSTKIILPSNRKFGYFFSLVFSLLAIYFYFNNSSFYLLSIILGVIFLLITLIKPEILLPLNKLWMRFGFLLSLFVSPLIMAIIFFGIFTPIGLFMRIIGRDELKLKFSKNISNWKKRESINLFAIDFKKQY